MKKVVWITVINKEKHEDVAKKVYQSVSRYGLGAAGHFWQDALEQMAWSNAREDLVKQETALWIIVGSRDDLSTESIRYGLSLLAIGVHSQKGHGFPMIIGLTDGNMETDDLPTPLRGAEILPASGAALGPKIAAKANMPVKNVPVDYRLDIYGVQGIGQWFEIGPAQGDWSGVMFGTAGGTINAHGVGPMQKLPERSILEYPMKGMTLQLGDKEYSAWAVKNTLTASDSYYLRVNDYPSSLVFGPMTDGEDAELYVVNLK
jgi:hypothetical protein